MGDETALAAGPTGGAAAARGELAEVRVVDLTTGITGAYCAKVLGDAGADVVLVEPADGHPLRSWACRAPLPPGETGGLFRYLHGGHRSVTELTDELLAGADVVLVEPGGPLGPPRALADAHPGLVVVSVSPYGLDGPWADAPWSELVLQAAAGSVGSRGRPNTPPLQMGGHITEWVSGAYAAVGALALLRRVGRGGHGGLVDLSMLEASNVTSTLFTDLTDQVRGRPDNTGIPARSYETPSIEPTLDGYVGFNTNTRTQFDAFLLLIERPELLEHPEWAAVGTRYVRWDEWNEIVHDWTGKHTTAETVERAAELRIPVAQVLDGPGLLEHEMITARQVYRADPTGSVQLPRRPWTIDGEPIPLPQATREVGADDGAVVPRARRGRVHGSDADRAGPLPLAGVRILDITAWWAGPSSTGILAALGAEVIHVESASHPDGIRMAGGIVFDKPAWWERSAIFLQANTNKRAITLELASPRGRQLLLDLVAQCDMVVENFTPRVLERFDLGWDVISAANPNVVMVRMPAFGLDGPWRDRPGFAQTMEQLTGLAWVTGFADDQPRIQRGPCDPNAGMHAAIAMLVALERRDRTGRGCLVEAPMVDAALNVAAEVVIEWSAYGHRLMRDGNRSWRAAPQGVYRCSGDDRWLAVSIMTDEQWAAFGGVLGSPPWHADPRFSTLAGRREHHDEIDGHLAALAVSIDPDDAAAALRAAGIPAAAVIDPRRSSEQPQLVARRYVERVEHPVAGPLDIPGVPFRLDGIDRWITTPPPTIGQHNGEVLGGLLGLDEAELAALADADIIATRPRGL